MSNLPDFRPFASSALLRTALLLLVSSVPVISHAQAIQAVRQDDGRVVFTNEAVPVAMHTQPAVAPEFAPPRQLVYWSVTRHQWVPVPPPSPNVMSKARLAAAEVASYIESQPGYVAPQQTGTAARRTATASRTAVSNPNYRSIAQGRMVTSADLDRIVEEAAQRHGVDANLVRAIIKVESNFNPGAVSSKGAMGLMQLMPSTARSLNVANPFDPAQNVEAGVRHFKGLLNNFKGDVALSLAAYNAGEGAVKSHGGRVPPFAETRNYVRKITGLATTTAVTTLPGPKMTMQRDERGRLVVTNE